MAARWMTSRWPRVTGSNEPGTTAILLMPTRLRGTSCASRAGSPHSAARLAPRAETRASRSPRQTPLGVSSRPSAFGSSV
ncbi:hypothetical protein ACFPRL_08690 [Pseudoclavibacter helvolus]